MLVNPTLLREELNGKYSNSHQNVTVKHIPAALRGQNFQEKRDEKLSKYRRGWNNFFFKKNKRSNMHKHSFSIPQTRILKEQL